MKLNPHVILLQFYPSVQRQHGLFRLTDDVILVALDDASLTNGTAPTPSEPIGPDTIRVEKQETI